MYETAIVQGIKSVEKASSDQYSVLAYLALEPYGTLLDPRGFNVDLNNDRDEHDIEYLYINVSPTRKRAA